MTLVKDLEPRIWFADTEVFAYDNIWVFTQYGTGATEVFWNDNKGVQDFIESERPILCGYNFRDYDQYILKGALCGMAPQELKVVNDIIIENGDDKYDRLFSYFDGKYPAVKVPPIIDLFHDIVPRRSLKVIEGNLGMSVKESNVDFNIDRPLTVEELQESIDYCKYDVYATSVLFEHRRDYIQSKITLCEICGEDFMPMLKHTNARILAEVFHAEEYDYDRDATYEIPPEIDTSEIPQEVLDYVKQCGNCSVADGRVKLELLPFEFHGAPSNFGIGGIHSAYEGSYVEESSDDRVILIQDITSYYPSIILKYDCTSRAAAPECRDMYKSFYHMRVEAKARGDKETANAAKLVLNTYSGAMGSPHNKLYDPMKPLSMRITGQLAIMDAVNCAMRNAPSATFIQLNTDGWVLSVDKKELDAVLSGVAEWEERTGFSVDTQYVKKIVQRDVNNYILEKPDGSVKVKGETVSLFAGGNFKSNSLGICNEAVVRYHLYGTPIEETIRGCTDLERFQLIAKAGSAFEYTVWVSDTESGDTPKECSYEKLHMCNRIFASKDAKDGCVYKVKHGPKRVKDSYGEWHEVPDTVEEYWTKIANCPPHAKVINGQTEKEDGLPEWLDVDWYISYAVKKSEKFVKKDGFGGTEMSEEAKTVGATVETAEAAKPKRRTPRKSTEQREDKPMSFVDKALSEQPKNLNEALFKLQVLMSASSGSVKFDGYIDNINYSYADTQQYKTLLVRCATDCGLFVGISMHDVAKDTDGYYGDYRWLTCKDDIDNALNGARHKDAPKRSRMIACVVDGQITFTFVGTGESVSYNISGMGVGTQGNCMSIAITNALRNFITNNFMLDNKGRDGDDVAANFAMDTISDKAKRQYVSDAEKKEIKENIISEKTEEAKYATTTYMSNLYPKLVKACEISEAFKESSAKAMAKAFADGKPVTRDGDEDHSIMPRKNATKLMREAEEIING